MLSLSYSKRSANSNYKESLPGGPLVKSLLSNARDTGLIPGRGRPHMLWGNRVHASQLLRPHSGGHEPQLPKPVCPGARALQQEKPPKWEASAMQLESSPCSPQLEMLTRSNEDPAQPKINYKEMVWWVIKKLNVGLAFDSAIPYIYVCIYIYICIYTHIHTPQKIASKDSNRNLYTHVQSSIIHNSQKLEKSQGSISGRMDKQNVVCLDNKISFSDKKE